MVFSGGFHGTPLCTNGSAGYLMQLSVNIYIWECVGACVHACINACGCF